MQLDEVIRRRRMVRRFLPDPIEEHVVYAMLDLARRGPSVGNSQGVDFVVLIGADETERFWGAVAPVSTGSGSFQPSSMRQSW